MAVGLDWVETGRHPWPGRIERMKKKKESGLQLLNRRKVKLARLQGDVGGPVDATMMSQCD